MVRQRRTEYLEAQEHGMESKDLLTLLSMFLMFTFERHKSENVVSQVKFLRRTF